MFQQLSNVVHCSSPLVSNVRCGKTSGHFVEHLLKPFRMLDEHLATIDYRQHDDQPDLKEQIQLIRHGASPY
jgi:hypothetical protein